MAIREMQCKRLVIINYFRSVAASLTDCCDNCGPISLLYNFYVLLDNLKNHSVPELLLIIALLLL